MTGISFSPGGGAPGIIPRFVAATAKHFVGDGGAEGGQDGGDTEVDSDEMRAVHMPPFARAVGANVAAVLMSYGTYQNDSMAASRYSSGQYSVVVYCSVLYVPALYCMVRDVPE